MSDETKAVLMNIEVIAIDQDPAAKPVKPIAEDGKAEVLARPLSDNSIAIGLFNRRDQPAEVSVNWDALNLAGKKLWARDLWKHQTVHVSGDYYSAAVPTYGVVLLKVAVAR